MVNGTFGVEKFSIQEASNMSRKAILWPVIISILIHMTLLAIAGMIDLRENIKPLDVLSISFKEPMLEKKSITKKSNKSKAKTRSVKSSKETGRSVGDDYWREDTIDLGSADVKYVTYLIKIKKKIMEIWKYPQEAFENNEEGDVVVKMSIDADGSLAEVTLLTSSGSATLDEAALRVVEQSAPYDPLPAIYNLSRLHIVASFDYKIMD